ncbi:MAG: group II intron maturase-specific domain-containing protein [Lentisphaeria bacterium]
MQTRGWGQYFSLGYPRKAFRDLNRYVQERLTRHLKRRRKNDATRAGCGKSACPVRRGGTERRF